MNSEHKTYEVWWSGCICSKKYGGAIYLGRTKARDFESACDMVMSIKEERRSNYNKKELTYWGYRLFDNEEDARMKMGKSYMKEYEVWCEGYACTGNYGEALFLGKTRAGDFASACNIVMSLTEERRKNYNKDRLTYWGCRLFDNEANARKNFG